MICSLTAPQVEILNDTCFCLPDQSGQHQKILGERLRDTTARGGDFAPFSKTAVFLGERDHAAMIAMIEATKTVVDAKAYQSEIERRQPDLPWMHKSPSPGLLMAYDFHVTLDGPRLIEINTNAGGAFVAKLLSGRISSSIDCCDIGNGKSEREIDTALHAMFLNEWAAARPVSALKTVAIVDENPTQQFLYPDMVLAAALLADKNIKVHICEAQDLTFVRGAVFYKNDRVDMIYNRLTDFMLTDPENAQLRAAFQADEVVLTPSPLHHALYADKRNLAILSDPERLAGWGINAAVRRALSIVPETNQLSKGDVEIWWRARKNYFFKPHAGFGSKAAYRGDKLTKKVWNEIAAGGFIAQWFVPAAKRAIRGRGDDGQLKYDIRIYAHGTQPLFTVARLYQGQTTNFRTTGGGFSEVIIV